MNSAAPFLFVSFLMRETADSEPCGAPSCKNLPIVNHFSLRSGSLSSKSCSCPMRAVHYRQKDEVGIRQLVKRMRRLLYDGPVKS